MKRVLVVDDERKMRRVLQMMLEQMELESLPAESGEEALEIFAAQKVDLVITDLHMPGMGGMECFKRLRALDAELPVIVLTAYGTIETAVEAMKLGAFDFILKPFDVEVVESAVRNALQFQTYRTENRYLRERYDRPAGLEDLIGGSPAMQEVFELIRRVAPTKSPVLITGETGTGKELVARAIHSLSSRHERLFVPLNCAAIPSELLESELFGHARGAFTGAQAARTGKFEVAHGGSLFLDEIGDMAYTLQAKLLRVLQEGVIEPLGSNQRMQVDVRIISSTNRDLAERMRTGTFREDLYYRLNVFHIAVPALRERREDVAPLAREFLARFARELGRGDLRLTDDALVPLEAYAWPGNVRELHNTMERAAVLGTAPQVDARLIRALLPGAISDDEPDPASRDPESLCLEPAVAALERRIVLRALQTSGDNKVEAARLLGVSERTLWYKLKKFRL
jgi:two-component system response regulator AtoC